MVSGRIVILICLKKSPVKCAYFRWYEAKVTGWKCTSSLKSLVVSVLARDTVPNCKIKFIDEVIIYPPFQSESSSTTISGDEAGRAKATANRSDRG